jgi:AAA domain
MTTASRRRVIITAPNRRVIIEPDGRSTTAANAQRATTISLDDLVNHPRWVAWRAETHQRNDGSKFKTKIPYDPNRQRQARIPTDPSTWGTRAEAEARWEELQREAPNALGGVGIVLGDLHDGTLLAGIDLDRCLTGGDDIAPWAVEVIQRFNTYGEVSPSGQGVKLFFRVAADDVDAVKILLDGKTRRAFAAGEHREIAIDRARYYAITYDQLLNVPETLRVAEVGDVRWFVEQAGPAFERLHGVGDKAKDGAAAAGSAADEELPANLRTLLHVKGAGGYASRHELVFAFLTGAIRAGVADTVIIGAVLDERFVGNGIYEHIQDIGGRKEAERQLRRAREKAYEKAGHKDAETRPLVRRCIDQFERREIDWLWHPFIPKGMITLMCGDKAVGKSSLAIDVAARISTGRAWPRFGDDDEARALQGSVIILCKENDISRIIRPRLEAAGADLRRIHTLGYEVPDDPEQIDPLERLDTTVKDLQRQVSEIGDVRFIYIDPITDYISKIDMYRDDQVRSLLNPLGRLASQHDLAILCILHLNKKTDLPAKYRGLGSVAFRNVSQSTLMVALNNDMPGERYMAQDAANLCAETRSVSFSMISAGHYHRIDWGPDWEDADIDAIMTDKRQQTRQQQAEKMLREWLADGAVPVKDLQRLAKEQGISWRTMTSAKNQIDVVSDKPKGQLNGPWSWRLPNTLPAERCRRMQRRMQNP